MSNYLWELPHDIRTSIAATLRHEQMSLTEDISASIGGMAGVDPSGTREFSSILVHLFASAAEAGGLDQSRRVLHDFADAAGTMLVRHVIQAIHRAERVMLDELALDEELGATSERWPMTAHVIRTASFEIVAAYAERDSRMVLRDQLTTLISEHVFRLALEQETERANRYARGISIILFDVDNLSEVNQSQGFGAGDRLLERLGISARSFFRTHDWVARHDNDAIAVLLPETPLDQATTLATRFREMVQQRLLLVDHKTEEMVRVSISAAAVGTDAVQIGIDAGQIMTQARAALERAKREGGNRTESFALVAATVTIIGAATLLGTSPREVAGLIRGGALRGTRRGRHVHIDRTHVEELKRTRARDD